MRLEREGEKFIGVCGRPRSEEGGREVCVGCRHAVGNKKDKGFWLMANRRGQSWYSDKSGVHRSTWSSQEPK